MISIVIPTIKGRERHYQRAWRAYEERTEAEHEILTLRNFDGCGKAWNAGMGLARGEFIHFSADDLEPMPGWDQAALKIYAEGALPSPVTLDPQGRVESAGGHWDRLPGNGAITLGTCTIPFFPASAWPDIGPIIEAHYFTDNYFTDRARAAGFEFLVSWRYVFKHHWAKEGRDEARRMAADREIYNAARSVSS